MYSSLLTTQLDDEPISLHGDDSCGGGPCAVTTVALFRHAERRQATGCPTAAGEQIRTGAPQVIVKPVEGIVVPIPPHPAYTPTTLADGQAVAQRTFL